MERLDETERRLAELEAATVEEPIPSGEEDDDESDSLVEELETRLKAFGTEWTEF